MRDSLPSAAAPAAEPVEAVRVWRLDPGVELLHTTDSARLWTMYHERYGASLNLRGPFAWRYRGAVRECVPGDVALLQPGEAHTQTRLGAPHSCWTAFLAPDVVAGAAAELDLPAGGPLPALRGAQTRDRAVLAALRASQAVLVGGAAEGGEPGGGEPAGRPPPAEALLAEGLAAQTHVAALVRALLERCGERRRRVRAPDGPPVAAAVGRAREYLHAHFAEPVSLDALAGAAYLSKYHLARTFAAALGAPPHQYLTALRLARVRAWLAAGVPAARAALDAGFASPAHLHRHFVAAFGLTPGQYARAHGARGAARPPRHRPPEALPSEPLGTSASKSARS